MKQIVYESTEESRSRVFLNFRQLLVEPLVLPWRRRELLGVILRRELSVRFANSFFGRAWAVIAPLVMLAIYMFTYSIAFSSQTENSFRKPDAFSVFAGLVVFNLFMEIIGRGPLLMHEHLAFIKRSLFPAIILGWIAVLRAMVYAGIAGLLLLGALLIFRQSIPLTALLFPFILVPMVLFLVGLALGLSAIGAFTRDLSHLVFSFSPMLIFMTPVFYTIEQIPEHVRFYAYLNPMTAFVEMSRDVLVFGLVPSFWVYLATIAGSLFVFIGGNAIFSRYKDVLVDVI